MASKPRTEFIEDLRQKQLNVLAPDLLRNDRNVDDALWNGSSGAPRVQRIGGIILGLTFIFSAVCLCSILFEVHFVVAMVIPILFAAAGSRIVYKSFRPTQKSQHIQGEHVS